MNEDLKQQIREFNEIKYPHDEEKRIIITTLQADCDTSLISTIVTG